MYALPYLLLQRLHQAAIAARRRARTWHYLAWSAVAAVTASVMFVVAVGFMLLLWEVGLWPLSLVMAVALVLPVTASVIVRHVLVPAGAYRLAYVAGLVSRPGKDPPAYAMCVAAWALTHRPSGTGEVWLAEKRDQRKPLGDAEVVVTALLAAARGDADTARRLLRSVLMLVEDHPPVRELAGEWLACDAAERGAWQELADDAAAARWPATPLTYFLEGVAARTLAAPGAPGGLELWARWLLAPLRHATRPLRDVATSHASPPAPASTTSTRGDDAGEAAADPTAAPHAPLPRAISAHLAIGGTDASDASTLAATVRAWDAALSDGTTHTWLARRALELDAPLGAVDKALREIAASVTDDLARIAEAAQLGAPASHGPVGDALSRRLRHGRLDALEQGFTRWADRRHAGDVRSAIDEWREFTALHAAYTAAVSAGGTELRRLAFPHAFSKGSSMAAWLWNTRNEYAVSHAISRWLLDEALVVGDAEAIELGHKNCGLVVPTRTAAATRER